MQVVIYLYDLKNLGENRIGTYRLIGLTEFRDYAFDVIMGDLITKDTNVLQESLNSFNGLFSTDKGRSVALGDHVLLESGWNFLLVAVEKKRERKYDGCTTVSTTTRKRTAQTFDCPTRLTFRLGIVRAHPSIVPRLAGPGLKGCVFRRRYCCAARCEQWWR